MSYLKQKIESWLHGIITDRLIAFHAGMIERGEIDRASGRVVREHTIVPFSVPETKAGDEVK